MSERPGPAGRPPPAEELEPAGSAARPPLGGWGRLYALVIAALVADLVLLWRLTERYR